LKIPFKAEEMGTVKPLRICLRFRYGLTPGKGREILAKYAEQNKSILEQERMLEARMKKSRLSKTILDVDEDENETEEHNNTEKATPPT
jgi:hypothetical protein